MAGILPSQQLPELLTQVFPDRHLFRNPINIPAFENFLPATFGEDDCTERICAILSLVYTNNKFKILWERFVPNANSTKPPLASFSTTMAAKASRFRKANGLFPRDPFLGIRDRSTFDTTVDFVGAFFGLDNLFFGVTGRIDWPTFQQAVMDDLSDEGSGSVAQASHQSARVHYPLPIPQDIPALLRTALKQKGADIQTFSDWLLSRNQAFQHFYPATYQAYITAQQQQVTWTANDWSRHLNSELDAATGTNNQASSASASENAIAQQGSAYNLRSSAQQASRQDQRDPGQQGQGNEEAIETRDEYEEEPPSTWLPARLRDNVAPSTESHSDLIDIYRIVSRSLDTDLTKADLERIYMVPVPQEWLEGPTRKLNPAKIYTIFSRLNRPFVKVKDHRPLKDLSYTLRRTSPEGGAMSCVLNGVKYTFLWWTNRRGGYIEGCSTAALQKLKPSDHKKEIDYAVSLAQNQDLNWSWTNEAEFALTYTKTEEPHDTVQILRLKGDGKAFDTWVERNGSIL